MSRRKFQPEGPSGHSLEPRSLLSTTTTPMVAVESAAKSVSGVVRGTYTESSIPDAGSTTRLTGSGRFPGLGLSGLSGSLQSLGLIATGHATGNITITNRFGKIHLDLTGPTQTGGSALPTHFTFTVTGGSGHYLHASGSGSADVTETPVGDATGLRSHGRFRFHYKGSVRI